MSAANPPLRVAEVNAKSAGAGFSNPGAAELRLVSATAVAETSAHQAIAGMLAAPGALAAFTIVGDAHDESLRWAWRDYAPRLAALLAGPDPADAAILRQEVLARFACYLDHHDGMWKLLLGIGPRRDACLILPRRPESDEAVRWLPRLVPLASPRPWLKQHIERFVADQQAWWPCAAVDRAALEAGIYQWHDFLEESHRAAQRIEGEGADQLGDYWHAIMHRREPDYGNAKYWFRALGRHPLFTELARHADDLLIDGARRAAGAAAPWRSRLLGAGRWDPLAFVDLCAACADDEDAALALLARRLQSIEMSLLMKACARRAGLCAGSVD